MGQETPLAVHLTKRTDGSVVLHCVRADGSATWQRQDGPNAQFFPFHDLTHFAVETVLGLRRGFYGLIAEGWDIAETEGKSPRGRLPAEALLAEQLVGLFDRERVGGASPMPATEFNGYLRQLAASGNLADAPTFSDAQLDAVRRQVSELHGQWASLAAGATLKLSFDGS